MLGQAWGVVTMSVPPVVLRAICWGLSWQIYFKQVLLDA